jgi:LysM repeat protein
MLNGGRASAGGAHSSAGQSAVAFTTVTIQPGESLWQLAEHDAPNSDPRDFVQDVVNLNDLQSSTVQAGQQIAIPTKYTQQH